MSDEKKLDEILKNTRETNVLLQTINMFVNSCIMGVVTVIIIRSITKR